jgi:transcription initiation factor TFIIIB Brf1 subunit/transcription initiation factor TFIIB
MDALLSGMGEQLKICPICGGRAKRSTNKYGGYIECTKCGLRTRDNRKNDNGQIDDRWNERYIPTK